MTECSQNPLSGLWKPTQLQQLYYGPNCVRDHLLECLPNENSRAFIITGSSLANKTSLIKSVETLLGDRHAGTFSDIKQHAPVADLDRATDIVSTDPKLDTIISIGGGSPIDSAKAISYRLHSKTSTYLHHIAIPTTLSAAECTMLAGYTTSSNQKTSVASPSLVPHAILYDALFALPTPPSLFLTTAIRALDHALETLYHRTASESPARQMCLFAAAELFAALPLYKADPEDANTITRLQLAAHASLAFFGLNLAGGLGLSHSLGYALGSPYAIPHGVTSCLTLGRVVKLKARTGDAWAAEQIARVAPRIGVPVTGDARTDAEAVGERVLGLVAELGLATTLTERGVGRGEVGTIAKLATGKEDGKLFEDVKALVEGLY